LGAAARAEPRRSEARATQEHGRRDRVPSRGRTKKGPKATKHKRIMAIMYPPCGLEQTCACLPAWGGKMGRPPHAAAHRSPGRGSEVATAPRSSAGAPTCATAVGAPPPAFKTRPARSARRWLRWRGGPPHPPFPSERSWGLRGTDAVLTDGAQRSEQTRAERGSAALGTPKTASAPEKETSGAAPRGGFPRQCPPRRDQQLPDQRPDLAKARSARAAATRHAHQANKHERDMRHTTGQAPSVREGLAGAYRQEAFPQRNSSSTDPRGAGS
jgi:hypothetical protein